jgi:hypothetical protein
MVGSVSNAYKIKRIESLQKALREADAALEKRMRELVELLSAWSSCSRSCLQTEKLGVYRFYRTHLFSFPH